MYHSTSLSMHPAMVTQGDSNTFLPLPCHMEYLDPNHAIIPTKEHTNPFEGDRHQYISEQGVFIRQCSVEAYITIITQHWQITHMEGKTTSILCEENRSLDAAL